MLSTSERDYLFESMRFLLNEYDYEYSNNALLDIIDEWSIRKAGLIEAFKKHPNYLEGKFMIAFDADYERSIDIKASWAFRNWIINEACPVRNGNFPPEVQEACMDGGYLPQNIFDFFWFLGNYAERNTSESTTELINSVFPTIRARAGQKTSRVINKICQYLGFDKVDGYNREFAKYADSLSPMAIKRHTILSINPLDYLTMSFGNSWASCHTIDKENKRCMPNNYSGCYSSGTISYMLDEVSMVFYTVDASYDGDEYWNEPKINRQMFHYGAEKLIQARLYPQDNDGDDAAYAPYRNIVQNIIAAIFDFPNLWVLNKGIEEVRKYINHRGTNYPDYYHFSNVSVSRIKGSENNSTFDIGARPICIECGERHRTEDNINCCHGSYTCADCGCRINEDDVEWIGGEPYCRECCHWCECCEEYHRGDSTETRGGVYVCEDCLERHYSYCEECDEYVYEDDMVYIECEDRYVCRDCVEENYFYCDDCGEYFPIDERNEYDDYLSLCEECYNARIEDEDDEDDEEEN